MVSDFQRSTLFAPFLRYMRNKLRDWQKSILIALHINFKIQEKTLPQMG